MKRYTPEHEWIHLSDDGQATVGISDHAQDQLGDIVYVELPEVGRSVVAGEAIAVVESTKSVSDIYAPVAGTIAAINGAAADDPALVNTNAETDGWLFVISGVASGDLDALMDAAAYTAFVAAI